MPAPYHRQQQRGQHIAMRTRADEAAKYFSEVQWGMEPEGQETVPTRTDKVITEQIDIKQTPIEEEELDRSIRRLKISNGTK